MIFLLIKNNIEFPSAIANKILIISCFLHKNNVLISYFAKIPQISLIKNQNYNIIEMCFNYFDLKLLLIVFL